MAAPNGFVFSDAQNQRPHREIDGIFTAYNVHHHAASRRSHQLVVKLHTVLINENNKLSHALHHPNGQHQTLFSNHQAFGAESVQSRTPTPAVA
jgi:hypothetical protein